jgi:aminodeoxyfutalosine deaminase
VAWLGVASVEAMEPIDAFIDRLPKVELHLHLVGSASVPTVLELARRHPGGSGVPRSAAELAAFYEFRDFPHFADVYAAVSGLVREPADVAELVLGAARDLAGQNVRYAELTVTPYTFTASGMPVADLTEALDIAARSARRDHGVRIAYIFDVAGELGGPAAYATLEHALSRPPEALTGFGLAGIEQARPAYADVFRSVFAAAIAAGLHSVPHAGEMSGPATIWEALDGLRAERIGHGISCLDDPALVARLRESQVPLEVCPTSNVCTRQVPDLAAHPLPRLLAEGLFVTLNSDDPPMFGTTLTQEYRRAASVLGLDREQLADLAANGVRASFLDSTAKQALLAEIEAAASGAADDGKAPPSLQTWPSGRRTTP